MADALTSQASNLQTNVIHQFLHGYSEGHRLLAGSLKVPTDLARLMLRMSDLSGSSVVKGFDQYITGYPLDAINAYALAMTWYAPEMPRPGCVWTHTLALPMQTLGTIPSLGQLVHLFKRPARDASKDQYADTLSFSDFPPNAYPLDDLDRRDKLASILMAYYGWSQAGPVVIVARDSEEFSDTIFALWSQQWPCLRQQFAFCTGSLSARNLPDRPFDIQCAPQSSAKDVAREVGSENQGEGIFLTRSEKFISPVLTTAIEDATLPYGGSFRQFLWSVTDARSKRADFLSYVNLFDGFAGQGDVSALINLIAEIFPEPTAGAALKARLIANLKDERALSLLQALATTDKYSSFDSSLLDDESIRGFFSVSPEATRHLVSELFRLNLNPLGDEMLTKLVRAMNAEDAQKVVDERPQLLPAIFRANPGLAASSSLWSFAGDRRRELLDSLVAQELPSELVPQIVTALLDSGFDGFIRRTIEKWGRPAVFATLDWTENHEGRMSETCRGTLTFYVQDVLAWVESGPKSTAGVYASARIIAPYSYDFATHNASVWLPALRELQQSGKESEATYISTLLLALGLCNAPPAPLDLIGEFFEIIHKKAEIEQLRDDAWIMLQPLVLELHWYNNWDWCERLRRRLVSSFIEYSWPARELTNRIKDQKVVRDILKSAKHVRGGDSYFRG